MRPLRMDVLGLGGDWRVLAEKSSKWMFAQRELAAGFGPLLTFKETAAKVLKEPIPTEFLRHAGRLFHQKLARIL